MSLCSCRLLLCSLALLAGLGAADVTRTLALIKPDAMEHAAAIQDAAVLNGFKVLAYTKVMMDKDAAAQFYDEHKQSIFFEDLVNHMSSGPIAVLVLEKEDAVSSWRLLIGPTEPSLARRVAKESLRAQYGFDILRNAVHGSASVEAAKKEIGNFFPQYAEFDGEESWDYEGDYEGDEEQEEEEGESQDDDDDDEYEDDDEEENEEGYEEEEGEEGEGEEEEGEEGYEGADDGEEPDWVNDVYGDRSIDEEPDEYLDPDVDYDDEGRPVEAAGSGDEGKCSAKPAEGGSTGSCSAGGAEKVEVDHDEL